MPGKIIFGGGTDIHVQKGDPKHEGEPVFISHRYNEITSDDSHVYIGGTVTVEALRHSGIVQELIPGIHDHVSKISSKPIRHRATVAGNIANASPIGDITIMLLALDARLHLSTGRSIPLRDFYTGYKETDLSEEEIIVSISIRKRKDHLFNFEKVSRRPNLDVASVNSSVSIKVEKDVIEDVHISAGGVGPTPMHLEKTSTFLRGKDLTTDNIKDAARIADKEISPITDTRGSEEYKRLLLRQLIYAHFMKLFPKKRLEEGLL